jgi:hypothetical protein
LKTLFSILVTLTLCSVSAEEIIPSKDQIEQHRGTSSTKDGIRTQTGELDETGHGPITLYNIPFQDATISFSWKVDKEQKVLFLVDGKRNGKATHNLKVLFNGSYGKKSQSDQLTIMTYDGSTKAKKKATFNLNKYHAEPGQWHKTSITIKGNKVTVVINGKTFTASSEKFLTGTQRIGIGNDTGSIYTRDFKIIKKKLP